MPTDISVLSTHEALNSKSNCIDIKENTPAYDFQVTKIGECLNHQYDHATLVHLENQMMK